ncbi:hypothetical protein LOD99_15312 [Oopsacas minuta]|uniref:Uncharacterized protein n=1 Tax=Oopsacas minuta TaxID=111878 RepID=A0AAV7KBG3_9METZ|nr:hypothetical protein LOD99_15312 [Oopsacas minuta]
MELDTARVADYFVICGLNTNSRPVPNLCEIQEVHSVSSLEYVTHITAVRFDEKIPAEYVVRKNTPAGHRVDFRMSEFTTNYFHLCYKKSRDLDGPVSPISEIRVFLTDTNLPRDFQLVEWHSSQKPVNFGSLGREIYLGYRTTILHAHTVAITDLNLICVDKGEVPPPGFKRLKKNLDNHIMAKSKIHLCYKLAMPRPKAVYYTPEILSYYPTKEYPKDPLDRNILSFCMPAGVSIEVYDEDTLCPLPTSANFVFTRDDGVKSYGVAVTLYEPVPEDLRKIDMFKSLNVEASKKPNLFMSKAVVITSKWPFFPAFRTFLTTLYRISISKSVIPLERYIYNFMRGIPFPKPDGSKVMMQIGPESIFFSPPVNTLMPLNTAPFHTLLQCLNPKNIITLIHLVLLEQKIVLLSSVQSTLISVAESVQCLLYPFEWQTPYIPYILDTMTDMLDAPVPFIFGIHSLDFDVVPYLENPTSEVSFVDLDSDYIYEGISTKELARLALPKGPCKSLRRALTEIRQHIIGMGLSADDLAVDLAPINITARVEDQLARIDLLIQDAMLRFMIKLFTPYRSCLIQPTSVTIDHNECFNRKGFLQIMSKNERGFFMEFFDTQMFQKFIQDRFTDVENKLNFFDSCITKINAGAGSKEPLIEYFQIHADAIVRTEPVSSKGLPPNVTYSYNTFPNLNMDYFPEDVETEKDIIPKNFSQQLDATRVLKDAVKYKHDPFKWPRFLLGQCYSLWFLYLPTFIQNKSASEQVNIGNECLLLLEAIRSKDVLVTDEVAYLRLMEIGSEQKDLQLVRNVWKDLERGNTESSTNIFTLYSKALDNCYTRRAQLRWKKSIIAVLFFTSLYNSATIAGGSPFNKSLAPRGDLRRRVLRVKKKITLGSFYPEKIRISPMHRDGNDVMIEDEESMSDLTVEVLKQTVIDPACNTMLDSDSEDSMFNPPSLSPSPPPPEPSRHTPSPVSILSLPPIQMLREAKKYFKHSLKKTSVRLVNHHDTKLENVVRVNNEDSDAAFINKAMALKISDRLQNSIEAELESSMVLKTASVSGMNNRLSNSQILTSKDSGFTEFTGSKGAIDVDRKEYSSADNLTDTRQPQHSSTPDRLALQRSVTTPNPKLSPTDDSLANETRSTSFSPLPEPQQKSSNSPRRVVNQTSSSPDSLDSLRTDSSSGQTQIHPFTSLVIYMSSSTNCPHCMRQIYDEEIIAMWAAEDIDLQIKCQYCDKELIPKLTILMQGAMVKESIVKKKSIQPHPTKSLKTLFKKSISASTAEHPSVSRKSSITMPRNPVEAAIIPTPYIYSDVSERLTAAILEDTELQNVRLHTDLDDDVSELQGSYDDSGILRANSFAPADETYQYYRAYTSGVRTLPKRVRPRKPPRSQIQSTYNANVPYFESASNVRSRVQSVYYNHLSDSVSVDRGEMSTASSVFSLDNSSDLMESPMCFERTSFIEENDQSISQLIRNNLEGTDHILFNKDGKDNCLPDEGSMPFIGNMKNDRKLSTAFFPDENTTTDPYLEIKDELASKLESMPLRSGRSQSGSSTPSGRGSPDVRVGRYEDYISIPYLSPLVLRKSLENLINKEGHEFLSTIAFVKRSPFIYWNLIWYFQRLGLRSHLQDILLKCVHYKKCYIETLWEPIGPEVIVPFLHSFWKMRNLNQTISPNSTHRRIQQVEHILQAISINVECMDLVKAARHILDSRKLDSPDAPSPSMYREMLFLFLVLTKDDNSDMTEKLRKYDRHYKQTISYLPKEYSLMLTQYDHIPNDVFIHCRKIFGPLRII